MKKHELAKLALMGLASGMLTSNGIQALQSPLSESGLIAAGCGGKSGCSNIADKCGSKCSHVAGGCGGKQGCSSAVAGGCGGKQGCSSAVAGGCGGKQGCSSAVAEKETTKSLTSPAPIPHTSEKTPQTTPNTIDPNDQNIGYHLLTDDELTLELNDETFKTYQKLSPEAKALARLVASARCNQTNECKGLNACKTETNSCAGKGSCKGLGKCAFSDKNLAVRVVAEKMQDKRQALAK